MGNDFKSIYQFRISLRDIKPDIWRTIQVPETYTFWDLHVAIQDAMGWTDTHLHHFEILNPASGKKDIIGIPDDDFPVPQTLAGWKIKMASYFSNDNNSADYTYDFGDNWVHSIKLTKIIERQKGVKYPLCVGGKRACPPEDCGGPYGYPEFLDIIMDESHEEHEDYLDWAGGDFDPGHFDLAEVVFDDPGERLKSMLQA